MDICSKSMDQIMSMFTSTEPFALLFAKEKFWRVLPNVIGIYLEFSGLYILVEFFRPRSFLKATKINPKKTVLRI